MAKKNFWLGMLVIILIFGVTVAGCVGGTKTTDSSLNGTWLWTDTIGGLTVEKELNFNNGNFESSTNGEPTIQGTYTANDGKITISVTQAHGSVFELESNWYSKSELKAALISSFEMYMSEENINVLVDEMFSPQTSDYSVSDNTLTLTSEYNGNTSTETYIKE